MPTTFVASLYLDRAGRHASDRKALRPHRSQVTPVSTRYSAAVGRSRAGARTAIGYAWMLVAQRLLGLVDDGSGESKSLSDEVPPRT